LTLFFFRTYTAHQSSNPVMRTSFRLRLATVLAFVLAVACVATSRPFAAGQAGAREQTLYVSAVDTKGEPVEGLGPDAFIVTEDGRRREVLRVSRAVEPIDIALLIDNSAAAREATNDLRTALSAFAAKMAPANQIAVITLADRPTIVTDYTNDPKKLSDAVKVFPMPNSGMTLLDGLIETSKGMGKRESPRAVIVAVITDGPEFTNYYSRDVVRAMTEAQVQLHLVGIGRFLHSEEHAIRERSFLLTEGPRATGGQLVTLLAPNGLDQALQRVARQLSSQYKVVYGRPDSLVPPEKTDVSSARADITMRGSPSRESKVTR
jgi:Ca-activated chloride channel homolog